MGTYYKYVNHTRKEYVSLSDLRDGGDKMNAVLWCGAVLGYLLMPGYLGDDKERYHGRWHTKGALESFVFENKPLRGDGSQGAFQCVQVEADHSDAYYDMKESYTNITAGVLAEMRKHEWDLFDRVVERNDRQRNCPEYHTVSGGGYEPCVLPNGHAGAHAYGEWVGLSGDDLNNYRKRAK